MISLIVKDMEATLAHIHKFERGKSNPAAVASSMQLQEREAGIIRSKHSGYLQEFDHPALREAATNHNAEIELTYRPGQFILKGDVIAKVYPAAATSGLEWITLESIQIGRHRVLSQDVEFGLYQIVEIAIRALSPAVNDTFTGVACVDCICDSLRIILGSEIYDGTWYDKSGTLRLKEPQLRFERLLKVAFDQIRQAAADTPAVLIRMLSSIGRLAPLLRNDSEREAMLDQAAAIWEVASTGKIVALDLKDIEHAWMHTRAVLLSEERAQT